MMLLLTSAAGVSASVGVPAASEAASKRAVDGSRLISEVRPGTILAREWNGRMHRVAVLSEGFAWNGKTYPSLSKIALGITGTRWNGPRFFGLRDKPVREVSS